MSQISNVAPLSAGDVVNLSDDKANRLIAAGFAERVAEDTPRQEERMVMREIKKPTLRKTRRRKK